METIACTSLGVRLANIRASVCCHMSMMEPLELFLNSALAIVAWSANKKYSVRRGSSSGRVAFAKLHTVLAYASPPM